MQYFDLRMALAFIQVLGVGLKLELFYCMVHMPSMKSGYRQTLVGSFMFKKNVKTVTPDVRSCPRLSTCSHIESDYNTSETHKHDIAVSGY